MTIAKNETSGSPLGNVALTLGVVGLVLGVVNILFVVFDYFVSYDGVRVFGLLQAITGVDLLLLAIFWTRGFNVKGIDWESIPMWILVFVSALLAGFATHRAFVLDIWFWWVPFVHLGLFLASIGIPNLNWYRNRFNPFNVTLGNS